MVNKKIPSVFYYIFIILLVVFLLNLFGALKVLYGALEKTLIIPVKQKTFDWQKNLKKDLNGCLLQNKKQVAELKVQLATLWEENLQQKRLLSAPLPKNWQFTVAKVIEANNETLTLDIGRSDGVKEDMVAIAESTYLGKVSVVSEKQSQVKLPSFIDERLVVNIVSVKLDNILGKGLLIGRGQGKMKIEQILSTEGADVGNLVTTSVDNQDLLVGEIDNVFWNKGEVFKAAQVKLLYSSQELNTIFLIRGKI